MRISVQHHLGRAPSHAFPKIVTAPPTFLGSSPRGLRPSQPASRLLLRADVFSPPVPPPGPAVSEFRRIHHYHAMPGIPRLLAWSDPSRTGDHTAVTRYAGGLSLQFDHLARVVGTGAAHIFLGVALGVLWGIGLRQSIHSMMIGTRIKRGLRSDRQVIRNHGARAAAPDASTPTYVQALLDQNRSDYRQANYYMCMDGSAALGAAVVGIGDLFRHPLIGYLVKALVPAAIPTLSVGFGPLVAPGAIGAADRCFRAIRTRYKNNRMQAYLAQSGLPQAAAVGALYQERMRELRTYYFWDAAAFVGLTGGAAISVFAGPGGLLLLVPATFGVLVAEGLARRFTQVRDAVPLAERLQLTDDATICDTILASHRDFAPLHALRQARSGDYPRGWGTYARPLLRLWRQHNLQRVAPNDRLVKYRVFTAFAQRETALGLLYQDVPPFALYALLDQIHLRDAFAKSILGDRLLRRHLMGNGVSIEGKKWSLNHLELARFMVAHRWGCHHHRFMIERVYDHAEEVFLTAGKTATHRRQRALLDLYGRFVRTRVKACEPRGVGQWWKNIRGGFAAEMAPPAALGAPGNAA